MPFVNKGKKCKCSFILVVSSPIILTAHSTTWLNFKHAFPRRTCKFHLPITQTAASTHVLLFLYSLHFFCRVIRCLKILSTLQSSNITSNFRNAAMFINTDFQICVSVSMIFQSNLAVLNSSNILHPPTSLFCYFLPGKKKILLKITT